MRKQVIKLEGATVVEVIVALVIIMLVFGIATMTYVRIVNSSSNPKLRLQQQLMVLAGEANSGFNDPQDQTYQLENDIEIQQRVTQYEESNQLLLIELEAFNKQEQSLAVYRKIIQKKSDETP
ncbi:hypothetical protein RYH73_06390 [Olivibacter sp. CPCC 100613]|uniref:hypothetical protein n=1 Tax=Olivibacter sp. CPCC 100613 TaxID=3079931 RepID=UPI002FF6AAC6